MDRVKEDVIGGVPFDLPDLKLIQDNIESYFNAIGTILGKKNAILSGCEVLNGKVEAGYILLNGEILKYTGETMGVSAGENLWWRKETEETNTVTTELGEQVDSWIIKRAKPSKTQVNGSMQLPRIIIAHTEELFTHPATHLATMIVETATRLFFTPQERQKLAGIANGANKYDHPATHLASMIVETATRLFFTPEERQKLAGIANGANKYDHPATHLASMIVETATRLFFTPEERQKLAGIANGANNYTPPSSYSADMVDETTNRQFVTAAEKTKFNNTYERIFKGSLMAPNVVLLFRGAYTGTSKVKRDAGVAACVVTRKSKGFYMVAHTAGGILGYLPSVNPHGSTSELTIKAEVTGIFSSSFYVTASDDVSPNDVDFDITIFGWEI